MEYPALRGCSILVVDGEARVILEIMTALQGAGATATATTFIRHVLTLVEHDDDLSAAILLSDGDRTELHALLRARGIPYVSYSGGPRTGKNLGHLSKPVLIVELMKTLEGLLSGSPAGS